MTRRRSMTALRRARIFDAHEGVCHICGLKIAVGDAWDAEHIIALEISGDDSDENLAPAHKDCHRTKTADDAGLIAKARRVHAKHIGAYRPKRRLGGKRFDGTPIFPRRD
jgi:5-methylcytosine-specific restriction endonuclease McrA